MHLLVEDYLPNDDKPKNVYVKQEQRQNLFKAMPCKEEEGRRPTDE